MHRALEFGRYDVIDRTVKDLILEPFIRQIPNPKINLLKKKPDRPKEEWETS